MHQGIVTEYLKAIWSIVITVTMEDCNPYLKNTYDDPFAASDCLLIELLLLSSFASHKFSCTKL